MKRTHLLGMSLFTGGIVLSVSLPAQAQCVVADVAVQAAITGSRTPAQQSNAVSIDAPTTCRGNTSVHTSRQINVGGTSPVVQERRSRHRLAGSEEGGTPVAVPVQVQVDVYNAAEPLHRR